MTCGRWYGCSGCGRHFGGLRAFDRHFIGRPSDEAHRCGTDEELRGRGLMRSERQGTAVWVSDSFRKPFPTRTRPRESNADAGAGQSPGPTTSGPQSGDPAR